MSNRKVVSIATFNANNFYLRYKFANAFPGDLSKKSTDEAKDAFGFLPSFYSASGAITKDYIVWDSKRREVGALALKEPDGKFPDVLCLQEVESIEVLRTFNQRYLDSYYDHAILMDCYDIRNIDVGVLSKFPIDAIRTHMDDKVDGNRVFSRDCLEIDVVVPGKEMLTLFVNHLKSKLVIKRKNESEKDYLEDLRTCHGKRERQAKKLVDIVGERFPKSSDTALYAVIGDFNDSPYSPYLKPILNYPRLTDIIRKYRAPNDRWTYYWYSRNRVSQIDYILASKALAGRIDEVVKKSPFLKPHIERGGLAYKHSTSPTGNILPATLTYFEPDKVTSKPSSKCPPNEKIEFDFPRFMPVSDDYKNNISDHCPVKVWFEVS